LAQEVEATEASRAADPPPESGPATDCWDANDSQAKFRLSGNDTSTTTTTTTTTTAIVEAKTMPTLYPRR